MEKNLIDETEFKYVLYTAYNPKEIESFNLWHEKKKSPDSIKKTKMFEKFESHLPRLKELLTYSELPGMLVMFIPTGWIELTKNLKDGISPEDEYSEKMQFAKDFRKTIEKSIEKHGLNKYIRVLTPLNIYTSIWKYTNREMLREIRNYFIGEREKLHYDAPKIPEAIVRLRLLGTGVPVLRLDHDVLFTGKNDKILDLGLYKPIQAMLNACERRETDPRIFSWVISGSYNYRDLVPESFDSWSNAFATRVYPALLCRNIDCFGQTDIDWHDFCEKSFDQNITKRFFGVKIENGEVVSSDNGLILIGANPVSAVISGALLCLSSGAIIDLPPFSNFSQNVMWIDDHIKYALHKSLRHLANIKVSRGVELTARITSAIVNKGRDIPNNVPFYTTQVYIPSLVFGSIMDYWIQPETKDKTRIGAGIYPKKGAFSAILQRSLYQGMLPDKISEFDLFNHGSKEQITPNKLLEKTALVRIREIHKQWSDLVIDENGKTIPSFASIWVRGQIPDKHGLKRGLLKKEDCKINSDKIEFADLDNDFVQNVKNLITDSLNYIRFALAWPTFIRFFRAPEQGSLNSDIGRSLD
ncbi:hypothetical protein MHK_000244 [Candidatus Magnetomorum sp. HK-1]|nr:hypothetical protein MHK_000244 [Candidatus Magnetomorum sp. HK-1]